MSTISTSDFKKGIYIEFKNEPHQIVEFQHVNPGKGSAFVRTKLKSTKTGRVQEFTYKSGETVIEYLVETKEMQYLYKQGEEFVFMDNQSFEQIEVPEKLIGDFKVYMKANDIYQLLIHEDAAIGIRLPKKVRLTVTEADEGTKGNSVSGATKTVVVETGAVITVPLFIKQGDVIAIDPETNSYLERA
jgi:elongation factor P